MVQAVLTGERMRQRMGDYAAAEVEFTAAMRLDPKSFDAVVGRGTVLAELNAPSGDAA